MRTSIPPFQKARPFFGHRLCLPILKATNFICREVARREVSNYAEDLSHVQ